MAAKRVDPLKAKQAKQKKLAIVLCVVFAAVLAFQVPRTLKLIQGAEPVPVAAAATTSDAAAVPVPLTPAATGAPVAAGAVPPAVGDAQPAVLADSDVPAAAAEGQLRSFELFGTKDPFAQPGGGEADGAAAAAPAGGTGTPPPAVASAVAGVPAGTTAAQSAGPAPAAASAPTGFTPTAPGAAAPAAATSISVNGVAEDVATDAGFPAAEPVFVLVSLAADGKSVELGIAGGTYADGAETITLRIGKPLTLRNTADGTEYVLVLKSVAGFAPQQ